MDADAGRVRTALRLQAVAARVHHMDCAGFAEEVCDAVDVAGRLGYLGCLHAVVRLAAAREAMPDADGMTCGELGCLAGLRRQARADLMKMRERSYGGRTVDISAHIKGRSQKNTFRLHFYIDRENELIVIGHAGCHMKTAGSHRRGFK